MNHLRIGTRGSRLALAQATWVARELAARVPSLELELVEIRTSGDRITDQPLGPHLGRAFFTKEIEQALLDGRVDLAVHSCKDLATTLPAGLRLAAVPEREDPRDALVSGSGRLEDLPRGARVGTSSVRRQRFLALLRPDLSLLDQRGNVPSRVRAVDEGHLAGTVLAVAGLRRLGMQERATQIFDPSEMLPAAGQGALAIEVREGDSRAMDVVEALDHAPARAEVTAERSCLRVLMAGCQAPVGALARARAGSVSVEVAVLAPDGVVRASATGSQDEPAAPGEAAARQVLTKLGVASLRGAAWAGPPPRAAVDAE